MLIFETFRHYIAVARAALKEEKARGKKLKLNRHEREFQAAAIEILETPASPIGRLLAASLLTLFVIGIVWSIFGRLDIHAELQGRIVPIGQVKVIEPLVTGKIKTIHVHQGQEVAAGDLLIELDPTEQTADRVRLEEDLSTSELISKRSRIAIAIVAEGRKFADAKLEAPAGTPARATAVQQDLLKQTLETYAATQASIAADIRQREMQRKSTEATITERTKLVAVMEERVDMLRKLSESGSASRAAYLEKAQFLYEQRAELAKEKGTIAEISAEIVGFERRARQRKETFLEERTKELEENEKRIAALRQELRKARQREIQSLLRAPVAGKVQHLSVHTIGEVVTTGEQVMIIVPKGTRLEIEAMLLNRDRGFVREGQIARIKVETFNFTKYGTIEGKVISVSNDAVDLSQQNGKPGQGPSPLLVSTPARLVFPVHISLKRQTIRIEGHDVPLSPGMSVVAEVKTGDRRIIEYLLSPLLRLRDESLTER